MFEAIFTLETMEFIEANFIWAIVASLWGGTIYLWFEYKSWLKKYKRLFTKTPTLAITEFDSETRTKLNNSKN